MSEIVTGTTSPDSPHPTIPPINTDTEQLPPTTRGKQLRKRPEKKNRDNSSAIPSSTANGTIEEVKTFESSPSPGKKLDLSHLHPFVTESKLLAVFTGERFVNVTPLRSKIIFFGPKSTGRAWIEFKTSEEAFNVFRELQKSPLFILDQKVEVSMSDKNKVERQVKKAQRKSNQVKANLWDAEVEQVKKKFSSSSSSFEIDLEGCKGREEEFATSFVLGFLPSDPDFPFELAESVVKVRMLLPPTYPSQPCRFELLNQDIPPHVRSNISEAIDSRAKRAYLRKPMMLGLVRFLDNNLERLLVDKKTTIGKSSSSFCHMDSSNPVIEHQLRLHGIEVVIPKPKSQPSKREVDESVLAPKGCVLVELKKNRSDAEDEDWRRTKVALPTKENEEANGVEGQEDAKRSGKEREVAPATKEFSISTAHRGTQISVEGKMQEGIGIVRCTSLKLLTVCQRCRQFAEYGLSPFSSSSSSSSSTTNPMSLCSKCHSAQEVSFRPEMMHETAAVLGYLDLGGCRPFDILPSNFSSTCLECNTEVCFNNFAFGTTLTTTNCTFCHQRLTLRLESFRFFKIRPTPEHLPEIIKKPKVKDPNMDGIVVGKQLPKRGACKHYKKSYRWLRFPCCGRAFPCDICHDENFAGEHESKWATRMICGFCSREQPVNNKPCVSCGGDLAGFSKSEFWEGGQGCRDKKFMNNKDPHKFKNSHLKTHSKKSERVGAAGAANAGKK